MPGRCFRAFSALVLSAGYFPGSAQVVDDFSDGDLVNGALWQGDTAMFVVTDDDGDLRLRSNCSCPVATNYYLSTPQTLVDDVRWELLVDLRFATSGVNYVDVVLISNLPERELSEGYFLRVGGTADRVELFRSDGGPAQSLGVQSPDGVVNSSTVNVFLLRVERTALGQWTVWYDDGAVGTYSLAGSVLDNTYTSSAYFGLGILQSTAASVVNNHFFDDVSVGPIPIDLAPPLLLSAQAESPTEVLLHFSEPLDSASAVAQEHYAISGGVALQSAVRLAPDAVRLSTSVALQSGTTYAITVNGAADLVGNVLLDGTAEFLYVLLSEVQPGDVVINEVLYDPRGSGSDMVEIYNRSNKVFNLSGWQLANVADDVINDPETIADTNLLLWPGEYLVFVEDAADILANYATTVVHRLFVSDLPSYNNGEGTVVLLAPNGDVLDRFTYHDDLHFELLANTEGVSLERVDAERPTEDPTNWHSAASTVGFATPGYRNSQAADAPAMDGTLSMAPAIFSPDNDGYQDLLTIAYSFGAPGFVGNMAVYDVAGREVARLMENELLGPNGYISWSGIMKGGELAPIGPYVVVLEAFDLAGRVHRFKGTAVLAHRLDRADR
jgi:Lamin Tail Domain/Bacterial Ig-like domain